jgi:hypothetical protein
VRPPRSDRCRGPRTLETLWWIPRGNAVTDWTEWRRVTRDSLNDRFKTRRTWRFVVLKDDAY